MCLINIMIRKCMLRNNGLIGRTILDMDGRRVEVAREDDRVARHGNGHRQDVPRPDRRAAGDIQLPGTREPGRGIGGAQGKAGAQRQAKTDTREAKQSEFHRWRLMADCTLGGFRADTSRDRAISPGRHADAADLAVPAICTSMRT